MFFRINGRGKYRYLQLVENHRQGYRTVQRILLSLGRLDRLVAREGVDALIRSLARVRQDMMPGEMQSNPDKHPFRVNSRGDGKADQAARSADLVRSARAATQAGETLESRAPEVGTQPHHHSTIEGLRESPILSGLDERYLAGFSRLARSRMLQRGEFLFLEDDPVDKWYVVLSGMIKAVRHSPSGKDIVAAIYGPGDTLANILLFVDKPHIFSGQAIISTKVLEITKQDFVFFLNRHPEVGFKMLLKMLSFGGRRFHDATVLLSELAAERTDYRLARILLTLGLEFGAVIPLTQREIAEMAGTTTETATRFLSRLRQAGIVEQYRGRVTILNPDQLRHLARIPVPK
ncbi:MAG: Crp/Fnr family transcriptional regulator [Chloroflexi bacterium]|nr:Crp/Fnr family transcriptional regulator [Chloroflexota bacterium]